MANILGTTGNDMLMGGEAADKIDGGAGNDTLFGQGGGDELRGGAGDDQLIGGDGNDILQGGSGTNALAGGVGNDIYVLEAGAIDTVVENANQGIDEIRANFSIALSDPLLQNIENLTFISNVGLTGTGNALANTMIGGNGDDLLSGGAGNDALNGAYGNDILIGGTGNDALFGGDGNDALDGSTGDDAMTGGKGDDTYYVDGADDKIVEQVSEGTDIVHSTAAAHTLDAHVEILILDGTADLDGAGNALANLITGNSGRNTLNGGAGNDTLDGGGGKDALAGGAGDDHYYIDETDTITEAADGGFDTIHPGFSCDLASLANVENVVLEGAAFSASGTAANNWLVGTGGANLLDGRAGNDVLKGGGGDDALIGGDDNDTLEGGVGTNALAGGAGNDLYILTTGAIDTIVEAAGQGVDALQLSFDIDFRGNPALANVENLVFVSNSGRSGTGNGLDNSVIGGNGDDLLRGEAGNDALNGAYGHDKLRGDEGNDALYGGSGDDTLDGGSGNDTMTGGTGNDTYGVDSKADIIVEKPNEGAHDTVQSALESYTLLADFEDLVLMTGAIDGIGNAIANQITGNGAANKLDGGAGDDWLRGGVGDDRLIGGAGNDTLEGGTGNDVLEGGAGNDTYVLAAGDKDTIIEAANGGVDTIKVSNAIYTLGANIENCMVGSADAKATKINGNALDNVLVGNVVKDTLEGKEGNDRLDGGAGADYLSGGDGNDTLEGGLGGDNIAGGAGADIFLYRLDNKADLAHLSDAILDFEHGKDKLDLSDLFDEFGITSVDPLVDGFLKIERDNSGDGYILFDSDGAAGAGPAVNVASLAGVGDATIADIIF